MEVSWLMQHQDEMRGMADSIKAILRTDVVIVDKGLHRICDTFPYIKGEVPSVRPLSVIGEVVKSGEPVVVNDKSIFHVCEDCPDKKKCRQGGVFGVPIFSGGQVEGAIALVVPSQSKKSFAYKAQDAIDHLNCFARLVGSRIDLHKESERRQRLEQYNAALLEAADYPQAIVGPGGAVLHGNRAFCQWMEETNACGREYPGAPPLAAVLEKLLDAAVPNGEPVLVPQAGVWRPAWLYGSPPDEQGARLLRFVPPAQLCRRPEDLFPPPQEHGFEKSAVMAQLLRRAEAPARLGLPFWMHGEAAVGKGALARAIHRKTGRRPLVTVACREHGCAALQELLFGAEASGAAPARFGAMQFAQGGSLLLADIEYLPLVLQARLAVALRQGVLEWGGEKRLVNVQLLVTSRRAPAALEKNGRLHPGLPPLFEEAQTLLVPPLRQRRKDAMHAFLYHLETFSRMAGCTRPVLTEEFCDAFGHQLWNGNLRDIQQLAERMVMDKKNGKPVLDTLLPAPREQQSMEALERGHILALLNSNLSKSDIAQKLHIARATLYRKIKKYGLDAAQQA